MAGNANSGKRKTKLFFDALMIELSSRDDKKGLRRVAQNLLDVAIDTNHKDWLAATKEIIDRVDGKVAQALVGGSEEDNPIQFAIGEAREFIASKLISLAARADAERNPE
jgi:hypothetical protein